MIQGPSFFSVFTSEYIVQIKYVLYWWPDIFSQNKASPDFYFTYFLISGILELTFSSVWCSEFFEVQK